MVMLDAKTANSEDDFSGRSRPEPGRYHVIVNHADEKPSKKNSTPGLEVEFQVLAGTVPNQAGKTIPLFLVYIGGDDGKTKTCIDRVTRLAICTGVIRPGEAKEPDWGEAIGRELVIAVEAQEYTDNNGQIKTGTQVAFMGFWSLGNEQVKDVPRDNDSPGMRALAKAGGPVNRPAAGSGNGAKAGQPAPQPAAQPAATAPARGKYSDL